MELITPSIGLIFWTSITFLILIFLLTKFAWKPILGALKEREESIKGALNSAEEARAQMANLTSKNERLLLEAKSERDALLKEAKLQATQMIELAKAGASEEANAIIIKAQAAIASEKNAAIAQIKEEAISLSIEVAQKILQKELSDKSSQEKYASELISNTELSQF